MCEFCQNHEQGDTLYEPSDWDGGIGFDYIRDIKYCPLCGRKLDSEDEPTTQTETQNSNLTFEKRTMRDCYNCERYETEDECIECHYEPKDECAKEYEELGLKELKELIKASRKTESNSEKPNNCEHITEDGVTCAKYPACDDCLGNPLNKVKGSERLLKGKDEPTISKMEQVDEPQTCYTCEYEWRDGADEPCVYCYGGSKYKPKDEPQKHCHRPSDVACHPEQGDMWCRGCDYWYANEPQTERSE